MRVFVDKRNTYFKSDFSFFFILALKIFLSFSRIVGNKNLRDFNKEVDINNK